MRDPFGLIGQVIDGHFRVDAVAGEGGFSVVYRGFHLGLSERIAIKCLKLPSAIGSALVESFMRRFRDEGKLLYRLSQGNLHIVRSIASGIAPSPATNALVPYIVLEWLEGISLASDLEQRRRAGKTGRSLHEAIGLLDSALDAVGYAHTQGVVHRDLNPGNIFLVRQGVAFRSKVLDFGVAKVVSDHAMEMGPRAPTFGQIRIFSPAYAAPEQFDANIGTVGPQTDVYTLAIVLMEVLSDREVVRGEHLGDFVAHVLNADTRPTPHAFGIDVGDEVDAVFAKATALAPSGRYKDTNEFYSNLKQAIRNDGNRPRHRPPPPSIDKFHSDDEPSPDTERELHAPNFKFTLTGTGDTLTLPPEQAIATQRPAAGRTIAMHRASPAIDPAASPPRPSAPAPTANLNTTLRMDTRALQNAASNPMPTPAPQAPWPPHISTPPMHPVFQSDSPMPLIVQPARSKGWVIALAVAGVALIAALVGSVVVFKLHARKKNVPSVTQTSPIASSGGTTDPPVSIDTPPSNSALLVAETAIPTSTSTSIPTATSTSTATAIPTSISSEAAAPLDPHAFNPTAAQTALGLIDVILASCKKPGGAGGPGKARVTFAEDGTVKSVSIAPPFTGTPEGECAAARFQTAHAPPFQGPPVTLDHPFHIPQ